MLVRFGMLLGHQFFQHSMQMRSRQLDSGIFVLTGTRLDSKHRTTTSIL